ncbi:MAG: UDP-N-acetylmuramate--L-alanine ligase, partial [Candidatus Latescibacteria bacterium]|nr:UDP-N-acetylmuramate--L-alanine ligase [Candidatus Latescibacterota bacterium]
LLDGFCRQGKTVAIAGTHGKSTTTTMIGLMLLDCGFDPTLIVGGVIPALGSNVRMGRGPYLAVEADEYSRSFLELTPEIAVVTSIDADHLEYYGNQDSIDEAFLAFIHATPCYQPVVLCLDDPGVHRLLPRIRRRVLTYGIDSAADVRATDIVLERLSSCCEVHVMGRSFGRLTMDRPGRYHILDALAAVATGHHLEIASDEILSSLSRFTGLERRFEVKGLKHGITVVDDYAHHPAEIAALLAGVTGASGRVVAVFQPHLYSRTLEFADAFGQALSQADLVVLTDVYASREQPIEGVTGELVAEATRKHGNQEVTYVHDKTELADRVSEQLRPNDLVITIGAGDITDVADEILKRI